MRLSVAKKRKHIKRQVIWGLTRIKGRRIKNYRTVLSPNAFYNEMIILPSASYRTCYTKISRGMIMIASVMHTTLMILDVLY
jgi:hypothetical protein